MNTKKIIYIAVSVILVLFCFVGCGSYFSYNNKEVALRAEAEAQRGKIEASHDKMWKIIQQKAQVSDQYRDAFEEIYPQLIEGRYSQGDGSLMKWITESNPSFSTDLYKDLMASIEIERTAVNNTQSRMLDIIREHKTLCNAYPGRWFISDTSPIEYEVISSTRSKQVMQTGMDDDVDLFKKSE